MRVPSAALLIAAAAVGCAVGVASAQAAAVALVLAIDVSESVSTERYILTIHWQTLENHTVDFRGGPLFTEWRAIVGPFFARPPVVEHFDRVVV